MKREKTASVVISSKWLWPVVASFFKDKFGVFQRVSDGANQSTRVPGSVLRTLTCLRLHFPHNPTVTVTAALRVVLGRLRPLALPLPVHRLASL
jgi:hypothetical protein